MTFHKRLTRVADVLAQLARSPLPSNQFQIVADHAPQLIACDYLAVCLLDTDRAGYLVHSLLGRAGAALPQRLFGLQEGVVGQALEGAETYITNELGNDPHGVADLEGTFCRLGLQSALVAPLYQDENPLGALMFASESSSAYDEKAGHIATLLTKGLSAALENARSYQLLADEHSMLKAVMRSTRDGILLVNVQGTVLMANPALEGMLGVREAAIVGSPLEEAIDNSTLMHLFHENRSGSVEVALADDRIAQANLIPVATAYGEPIGWAAVLNDVTVFKELEQMKNQFVNTVSHDLKNPISSILLGTDLLTAAGPLSAKQEEIRRRMSGSAHFMEELVSDLLSIGRVEAGLNLDRTGVDLVEVLQQAIEALKTEIQVKSLELEVSKLTTACVCGDRGWLKRVLINLIGNAVKYTPSGGRITVTVERASVDSPDAESMRRDEANGSGIVFSVCDTGIGIPATDLPYIFDKFYRVHHETTAEIEGTGLGLAIVKSVIETHQGYVWATSEEGEGSTFAFYLPLDHRLRFTTRVSGVMCQASGVSSDPS